MKDQAAQSLELAVKIRPELYRIRRKLAGKGPDVQGATLAELVAMWLAGHDPIIRGQIFERLERSARRTLVEVNERMLFGKLGHPGYCAALKSFGGAGPVGQTRTSPRLAL